MTSIYVTDHNYPMSKGLIQKLDLMIERVTQKNPKLDAVFQNEGAEGSGKTTLSVAEGYYISQKTGRPFSDKHVFLDVEKAVKFAQDTKEQIIIFDEPALGVLTTQVWNEIQQRLIQLLMLARKKRHFIIFNFTKFWKFNEYIVVDRCLGMTHLYERKDRREYAFVYIPRDRLEILYNDYKYKKKRNYFKYGIFDGKFPDVLNPEKKYNLLDIFDIKAYDKAKDEAINSIGKKKVSEVMKFKHQIANVTFPIMTQREYCKQTGIPERTLRMWKNGYFNEESQSEKEVETPLVEVIGKRQLLTLKPSSKRAVKNDLEYIQ